jgi:LmbE family N-acetylglucosaminyl deacetylase
MVTTSITGAGTSEAAWTRWLTGQAWPSLDLDLIEGRRVVVVAAHPDDEILGAGALLTELRTTAHPIVVVFATDGEASHPNSAALSPHALGARRRIESREALACIGVIPAATHFLGLPDGQLHSHRDRLRHALRHIVKPTDVVIAPWSGDGHPDHESAGSAARALDVTCWEYPIWMWHWATPADSRVPWSRMHRVRVDDVARKAAAIECFDTQIRPIGPNPEDDAVLPRHVLDRFLRNDEWILR